MSFLDGIKSHVKSKSFFIFLRNIFIVFAGISLIINIIIIYGYNSIPDTSFTGLAFTLVSLVIACHAVVIAIDSDEKMRSIATSNFYEITYRFWDRASKLYNTQIKELRDTQSWQLLNLFHHAELLKQWAEPDVQEKLIKEFKIFLERLRPTPCTKYWVEIKNYISICKIAMLYNNNKTDNSKDELITELSNWIGPKRKEETNIDYLQRKSDEFSIKNQYDIF